MKPILREFPDQFDTERLTIRSPRSGDGAEICRAVTESINELRPWMSWAQEAPTKEDSEARARQSWLEFQARTDLQLLLFLKGSNTLVGSSGLHRIDWDVPCFEVGYWCRTAYTGQGYITEAVAGITDFAFGTLGANRVTIFCDAKNERSAGIPQRLGYRHEAVLQKDSLSPSGELRDTFVFALLRDDWQNGQWGIKQDRQAGRQNVDASPELKPLSLDALTLPVMQEFHKALDEAKAFDPDFIKNVGYLASEMGEAVNAYRRLHKASSEREKHEQQAALAEELADCLAYIMKLANYGEVDLAAAYVEKMNRNIHREWKRSKS
ncbi:MAG: GNAT family N-acetyltransferase [Chloroflexota bacterium]